MTSTISSQSIQKTYKSISDFLSNLDSAVFDSKESFMEAWTEQKPAIIKSIKSSLTVKNKPIKDENAPKRGKTSYIIFCADKRAGVVKKNPDMSAKQIITELGRIWREDINDTEKEKYKTLATKDKARYDKEMESYVPPAHIEESKKNTKAKKKGPKNSLSSYMFFCQEVRPQVKTDNPNISAKEIMVELGRRWREISEDDKKPYVKLAAKDKKRYIKEKESFVETTSDKSGDEEPKKKSTKKSAKKSAKKSKKPKSTGYLLFAQEVRGDLESENEGKPKSFITKLINKQWKELDEEEQEDYKNRSKGEVVEEME